VPLAGTIMRCRHFRGKIHELGIRFDKAIDVKEFLGIEGSQDCYSLENVPPDSLTGSVLLIEPGEMDRALVRHHLRETNLTVTAVGTATEAIARAKEGYDIILCALELPDGDGLEVLSRLRDSGIQTPFVLMCSSAGPAAIRERLKVVHPQGLMCKPVPAQSLLSALGEFLLVAAKDLGGGGAAILSSLSPKDPLAEHIPEYLGQLKQLAERMGASLNNGDVQECTRVVAQIQGSSPTFGYGALTEAARQAHSALHTSQSLTESAGAVRKLIAMCYRAQAQRKAA
jgi:CheY-like chemotaxis protein